MREARFLAAAASEATEAAAFYELEQPGLGQQFEEALFDATALLRDDVLPVVAISARLSRQQVGRLLLRRFPFSVVVRQSDHIVEVIAVAHHSRRPNYWRGRLST
jgi:hypothetical protein